MQKLQEWRDDSVCKVFAVQNEDLSSDPNNDQKARHGSVPVIPALGKQGQKDPGGLAGLAGPAS